MAARRLRDENGPGLGLVAAAKQESGAHRERVALTDVKG